MPKGETILHIFLLKNKFTIMLVLEKRKVKIHNSTNRIYINTLTPNFNFKNKDGKVERLINCCVKI